MTGVEGNNPTFMTASIHTLEVSAVEDTFDAMHFNDDSTTVGKDLDGNAIRVGDFVRTLDRRTIRENAPSSFSEQKIANLADNMATVLEIREDDDTIYVDVHGKDFASEIKSAGVKFFGEGRSIALQDGTIMTVGSYVKSTSYGRINPSQPPLRSGHSCGRTGKVVRIDDDSNILVQFAWGGRFWFTSAQLIESSPGKLLE